jgi:hypothetical protein
VVFFLLIAKYRIPVFRNPTRHRTKSYISGGRGLAVPGDVETRVYHDGPAALFLLILAVRSALKRDSLFSLQISFLSCPLFLRRTSSCSILYAVRKHKRVLYTLPHLIPFLAKADSTRGTQVWRKRVMILTWMWMRLWKMQR